MATHRMTVLASTIVALALLGSNVEAQRHYHSDRSTQTWYRNDQQRRYGYRSDLIIPAGTPINVRLATKLSTDDVQAGDTWTGTVTQSVVANHQVVIPAGSQITGVVTSAEQGTHDTQASMNLAVRQATVNGQVRSFNAETQPIIAGTNRAKKLGAVGLGAAAGALVGHAVGGGGKGTLIGGLLGGVAGYGATRHAFRTMQLKPGTELTFTTTEDVAMRYR